MIEVMIPQAPMMAKLFESAPEMVQVALRNGIEKSIIYTQGLLRKNEPIDTGRMRNSTMSEMLPGVLNGVEGSVTVGVDYGIYVNDGTGQYALDQSKTTGRIRHGGIKPQQFMEKSVEEATPTIALYLDEAAAEVIKALL